MPVLSIVPVVMMVPGVHAAAVAAAAGGAGSDAAFVLSPPIPQPTTIP